VKEAEAFLTVPIDSRDSIPLPQWADRSSLAKDPWNIPVLVW
jgi:hypothetical protein